MNCPEVAAAELPERYLAGALSDAEQEAYEAHYFECDACFRELAVLRAARAVLAEDAPARTIVRKPLPRWLAAAASLIAAATLAAWWTSGRGTVPDRAESGPSSPPASATPSPGEGEPSRAAELTLMARFEPPRYDPPRLRSGSPASSPAFDRAMAHYQRGEHAAAVSGLEEHLRRRPDDVRAAFFLGVSLLASGNAEPAIARFERVLAAGDSAYEEEALYLVAKAHVARGDVGAAIAAIDRTIALAGDRAEEARTLRARLAALGAAKP